MTVCIIFLALASVALLGFGWRGGFSSHKFTPALWRGCSMAIVVLFYKVCFNTLDICLHWLLSRVLYGNSLEESNIEGPFEIECFQRHRRGFWSCWQIFPVVTARAVLSVPPNILGDLRYALVLGSSNVLPLIWRHIFRDIDCPKAPNFLFFFEVFEKTAPWLQTASWKVLSLLSVFFVSWWRRFLGLSSLISDGLTLVTVFPHHSADEERNKLR